MERSTGEKTRDTNHKAMNVDSTEGEKTKDTNAAASGAATSAISTRVRTRSGDPRSMFFAMGVFLCILALLFKFSHVLSPVKPNLNIAITSMN